MGRENVFAFPTQLPESIHGVSHIIEKTRRDLLVDVYSDIHRRIAADDRSSRLGCDINGLMAWRMAGQRHTTNSGKRFHIAIQNLNSAPHIMDQTGDIQTVVKRYGIDVRRSGVLKFLALHQYRRIWQQNVLPRMVHVKMCMEKIADIGRLEAVLAQLIFERLQLRSSSHLPLVRQSILHRTEAAIDQDGLLCA